MQNRSLEDFIRQVDSGRITMQMPNPMVPLPFEKYCGEPGESCEELEENFKLLNIMSGVVVMQGFGPNGDLPDVKDPGLKRRLERAHNIARRAHTAKKPNLLADQSLAIAETPEAYMVKAMYCSSSYEEALEYYNLGAEVGKKLMPNLGVGPYTIDAWDISDYSRSYVKVIHGQANTLRKMGRFAKSEEKYKFLFKVNRTYPSMQTEYANWRYHFLEVFMKQGKFEEAYRWAKDPLLGDSFDMYSCTRGAYYWSFALLDFICNKKRGFEEEYFSLGPTRRERSEEDFKAPFLCAFIAAPHVFDYITGRRKLPNSYIPKHMSISESLSNCLVYVHSNLSLWRETEGAIEWATKVINTLLCFCLLAGVHKEILKTLRIPYTDESFRRLIDEGIFIDAVVSRKGAHLVYFAGGFHVNKLRMLLEAGADVTACSGAACSPLIQLAYGDYNTEATKLLIKYGCDPYWHADVEDEYTPVGFAASLGHVRQVYVMVTLKRPPPDLAERLLPVIVDSQYYKCYKGLSEKCEICESHIIDKVNYPSHSKSTDFLAVVMLLLLHTPESRITEDHTRDGSGDGGNVGEKESCGGEKVTGSVDAVMEKISLKHKNDPDLAPLISEMRKITKLTKEQLEIKFDKKKTKLFPACARCRRDDDLRWCGRCKSVQYCSKNCQKTHWKIHKRHCCK